VASSEEIAMPAQHGIRANEQSEPAQRGSWQPVQQCGQQRPVRWGEADLVAVELSVQHGELVAQDQDFDVLVPITHRQQSEDGERGGQA
jgi:hypothetical protein